MTCKEDLVCSTKQIKWIRLVVRSKNTRKWWINKCFIMSVICSLCIWCLLLLMHLILLTITTKWLFLVNMKKFKELFKPQIEHSVREDLRQNYHIKYGEKRINCNENIRLLRSMASSIWNPRDCPSRPKSVFWGGRVLFPSPPLEAINSKHAQQQMKKALKKKILEIEQGWRDFTWN